MATKAYVEKGKWITDRLAPINAIMFISTGVLVPLLDLLSPNIPFTKIAVLAIGLVVIMGVLKLMRIPRRHQIPTGLFLTAMFCSIVVGASAFASFKHKNEGGLLASKVSGIAEIQKILLDIKSGRSDNPRVELANMGIMWDYLQFAKAAQRGDTKVVSLFVAGGMPVTDGEGQYFESIPFFVVNNGVNAPAVLEALAQGGVKLGSASLIPSWGRAKEEVAPNLYVVAMEKNRIATAQKLIELGVDGSGYKTWKTAKDEYEKKPKAVFFGIQ